MKSFASIFILSILMCSMDYREELPKSDQYQLLLPSQDSALSFIVHENQLGVYDNLNNRELLLEGLISSINISPINVYSSYVDLLASADNGELIITETYVITKAKDNNSKLSIRKNNAAKRINDWFSGYYYENNVRLIDTDKVIHNFSRVEPQSDSLLIVQRSGVYSLKEKRFIIPQKHIKIEASLSPSYDTNSLLYLTSLSIEENEYIHQMDVYDEEEGYLFDLPQENFRHGLYDVNMHEIIEPSTSEINPMQFGGFYHDHSLYDAAGQKLVIKSDLEISTEKGGVFVSSNYIINTEYGRSSDREMNWVIYEKDGAFVEVKFFDVLKFLAVPDRALGIIQKYDEEFEWIVYRGVYDFDENRMVIPAIYDEITIVENEGEYYFSCQKKENTVYFDKGFKEFALHKN